MADDTTAPDEKDEAPEADPTVEHAETEELREPGLNALRQERERATAAEQNARDTQARLDRVLEALGMADAPEDDPAAAAEQWRQQARRADLALAVFRSSPEGVDANALLDSQAFTQALSDIDPTDTASVQSAIADFVTAHPRFRATPAGAGHRDAASQSAGGPKAATMDDWIRGRR